MRKAAFGFAVAWQFRQAVLAVPLAMDNTSSSLVKTHDGYWASYMKAKGYPSNKDVCRMIRNMESDLFSRTWALDYYRIWMSDNGYIIGLLGPAGEAGLLREFAATEAQVVGTIGSFQLNTVAYCLTQAAKNREGSYLDISKLADELPMELVGVFDDTNNNIAGLTAKLFGGTSSETLLHIDLVEYVNTILPATDGKERIDNEAMAPWYLLQQNYRDWEESRDMLRSYFHNSFKYMKVGLIGHLFKLRGLYVMHFAWLERDRCLKIFDGASRYVDNGCFVLKIGGGGWKHLNHDDNAPTELYLAEEKYHLHLHNFFRNVRDCNNDERMMEHGKDAMGDLVLKHRCFFPIDYLVTREPGPAGLICDVDRNLANKLQRKIPHFCDFPNHAKK
ncbi:hypothetical protein DL762_006310 [Monosporascus cannonballus]|uniref:Uncharacterized protein n=1 Tax=Monosporascus cannonballus TaxID=155416 RepID=A0ABY0H6U2_9PEZI|nr:hypothetical protein DL762_006310 [Monosporascus cannonballus]RYP01402.1 hypothetical protein DL763_000212 [Monosporascus cannonballus]